ncbi:MAG: hypothetical protein ACRD9Q_01450 [Nitrososphaeraceae archaeon]
MPQSRLPDINSAFVTYRREIINSVHNNNYQSCFGSLYAINALLPPEYRVKISNIQYEAATKSEINAECYNCNEKTPYESVQVFDLLLPFVDSVVTGNDTIKVWICPKCNKECEITETKYFHSSVQQPHFEHCVPLPPERKHGLLDRTAYTKQVENWILTFLVELEERMGQFREDNWQKGGMQEDLEIDTSEDETDELLNDIQKGSVIKSKDSEPVQESASSENLTTDEVVSNF